MGNTKKYPDNVVWNKEDGYYAHLLPYASNIGAPVIKPDNVSTWKNEKILKTNHYFNKKYEEIKEQYQKLLEEFEWNSIVYNASDRKSTRLNSSHVSESRMPSSA